MKNKLKVTVAGPPGAGKTTVAAFIFSALEKAGFTHVVLEDDEYEDLCDVAAQDGAVLRLRSKTLQDKGTVIEIRTQQVRSTVGDV